MSAEQTFSEMLIKAQPSPREAAASASAPAKPSSPLAISSELALAAAPKPPLAGRRRPKKGQALRSPSSSVEHRPDQSVATSAGSGSQNQSALRDPRPQPKREASRQTLSIPEDHALAHPYAHEQLARLDEEDEVVMNVPARGTKVITSAERPGGDAPPPTPAANLYSPPGTGMPLPLDS